MATTSGPRVGDLGRLLAAWTASTLAIMVAAWLLPDLSATSRWAYVGVAAVAGVVGMVLRPVLVEVSARIGWLAVLPLAFAGQALVMHVALSLVPGVSSTWWTALAASWIGAAVGTLVSWVTTAGTDDGLVTSLARRSHRVVLDDPEVDGVVFVQLDGVAFPVLRWAVQSGAVPTIRRWLASGDYELREWTAQVPCTTPASQLGILHGTVDRIPAFRWYDRELGRVLVANRPADARVIEQRATTGDGLLADGGVSVSNLFTGDATRSVMTMSALEAKRGSAQTRRAFAWFLTTPQGFARSFSRTVGEIVKERWQARRQEQRDLDPRMHRGWTFAVMRATTNALLRDLNTALVAEEMARGTRSVYVDYVDYDEIAHHAGMFRPESLASLDGLDRVLATLERLASGAPRRYRIVVVSDHGQSQGRPFAARHGQELGALCSELMSVDVASYDEPVESWGRAGSVAGDLAPGDGVLGRVARKTEERVVHEQEAEAQPGQADDVVVLGSGNLGLLYVPGTTRWTLDQLDARWPRLIPGLAEHPGVGFVAGVDDAGVAWAVGPDGRHDLTTGTVHGQDPLAAFGEPAPRLLAKALSMAEAPDLYVNSSVDPDTLDVAAFEDLVGAHGGLGGWQTSAVLLAPRDLTAGLPERIEGADHVHRILVGMLRQCGHRQ